MKVAESEGKNRYDSSAILFMLMILEKEPVSRAQLAGRLAAMGINYTERTINRRLLDAEKLGFSFQRQGYDIVLNKNDKFYFSLFQLLIRWSSESASLRSIVIGIIDPARVSYHLEGKTVSFFYDIIKATLESRVIEFDYKPQTEETNRKLRDFLKKAKSTIFKKHENGFIRVQMIPHYHTFSGADFLLLGETYFSETDIRKRQYEIAGINNLFVKEVTLKRLSINPTELYQYSLNVWINGILYDLEVEEKHPAGDLRRKKIRVNGEAEILSYAASKLGNLKIINPPQTLVTRAQETPGLCEMIFLQKDI